MELEQWVETKLGQDIWNKKYKSENESFDEWLDRISGGNEDIKQLIKDKKFLFGGRILANRGLYKLGRKICYSNCFVVTPPEDNIESIFDCAKKMARTYSYGGGVGIDISKLAPRGAKVNNAAKETTGSVSFMGLYSLVTELIGMSGRRGALMISIDCNHPDLLEFIDVKKDLNKVTKANISIKITDDFMKAVQNNEDWTFKFIRNETEECIGKTVKAQDIFQKIIENNWDMAEPGALFWDRIEKYNLLSEDTNFKYAGVNPCAEEPLPAGGSCILGSINLSQLVLNPFTKDAVFDFDSFEKVVKIVVDGMNEVLDEGLPLLPLEEQLKSASNWRQIGIGVMGLADMLIKMSIKYGSKESLEICDMIGFTFADTAISESAILASRNEVYPMYSPVIKESSFFGSNTTFGTQELVDDYGLRNSQLLTIAPTGSISTMLGISGGMEPIYNNSYTRKTESLHGRDEYYKVYTPIVQEYMKIHNIQDEIALPDFFVTAMTLDYKDRINLQAVWQEHIDASISSTVNVLEDFTVEQVKDLYIYAWEKGLKGVTIFRDNCARTGILTNIDKKEEVSTTNITSSSNLAWGTTIDSSDDLIGKKRKIMSGCGSLHVQAWFDPSNGKLTEIYLSKGSDGGCISFMVALSRTISAGLRTGMSFDYAVDQLKSAPACPSYSVRTATKRDTSKGNCCPAAVANALIEMQKEVFYELGVDQDEVEEVKAEPKKLIQIQIKNKCPECGLELKFEGGCNSCSNCSYSKCD